ncbi:hypothetical protein EVAR_77692_1 [Eumeta japonica]|uniref:Uncharacterized protein n=1 Tax=Eumeta variegata TaxID=151549 RepID=A0A4C1SBP1_EUMVA|nr:hypothetical protein EVAR_77692_1 [Eumeta japonica]
MSVHAFLGRRAYSSRSRCKECRAVAHDLLRTSMNPRTRAANEDFGTARKSFIIPLRHLVAVKYNGFVTFKTKAVCISKVAYGWAGSTLGPSHVPRIAPGGSGTCSARAGGKLGIIIVFRSDDTFVQFKSLVGRERWLWRGTGPSAESDVYLVLITRCSTGPQESSRSDGRREIAL